MPSWFSSKGKGKKAELAAENPFTSTRSRITSFSSFKGSSKNSPAGDMPPPYSPTATNQQGPAKDDSEMGFLSKFDIVIVIDDSGSMCGSRWRETQDSLKAIAPICTSYDKDGLEIFFLNHRNPSNQLTGSYQNIRTPSGVEEIFQTVRPTSTTPTGERLQSILEPYVRRVEQMVDANGRPNPNAEQVKPLNVVVITDGVPTDDVETVLVLYAKRLDKCNAIPWQLGIQFLQVGNDQGAKEWLASLDDDLCKHYGVRDMVDTAPWEKKKLTHEKVLKIMLGAINKRFDRKAV
ncbi:hypothetical protein FQN55_007741 [Onygenales sp. PD_40]|nr:hypothetical protein FQN55_007741 [Onygenales sp. PD_40]KAK2775371.1 hypothetical protein FQN53_003158 [Emmonsiellopsis sp. PD_33]KAK2792632.1 hypothetical protein FQN52_003137 [Onygenales sp. PD_12]